MSRTLEDVCVVLGEIRERLPTREERLAEEELRAWDACVAACLADTTVSLDEAFTASEGMLLERRKRFGVSRKEKPEPGTVAVSRELLVKCISALRGGVPEHTRHLLADDLRALVSE